MKLFTSILAASCTTLATFMHLPAHAQAWPTKPAQEIVPGTPGEMMAGIVRSTESQ